MKNLITKGAKVEKMDITPEELSAINKYTIEPVSAEQIFTFKVAICDNEVDRDFEVFPRNSLEKLAAMFKGKTIMKDHKGQTDNQVARIYAAEVADGHGTTKNGEGYAQLVAHCYMVRTESNKDLITEIMAGIKKEVSVGCRIKKAICSICGTDNREGYCKHWHGREYDGKQCYFKLEDPQDAYEVSFVAIPAQPQAGVVKIYTGEKYEYANNENEENKKKDLIGVDLGSVESFLFVNKEREEKNYE